MASRDSMEALLDILECDSCRTRPLRMEPSGSELSCSGCDVKVPVRNGIVDLKREAGPAPSFSQRMMEFRPLVRFYERFWRPLITLTVTSYRWERERVDEFMGLGAGMAVMDLACGTGYEARRFARATSPRGFVIGVDMSLAMLERAGAYLERDAIRNVALVRSDVLSCSFFGGSFDRVHCSGALHLFGRMPEVFKRIFTWLKPGGVFVGSTYLLGKNKLRRRRKRQTGERIGFHWFDPEELETLAKEAGFDGYTADICREGIVFKASKH